MLTSYFVKCPHPGCDFFGSLLPTGDLEAWRNAVPGRNEVRFCCPRCGKDWRARLAGDTPIPLLATGEEPLAGGPEEVIPKAASI